MKAMGPLGSATSGDRRDHDRRGTDVGPPPGLHDRRHVTPSGRRATDVNKIPCPWCGASESRVARSRQTLRSEELEIVSRRRECANCGERVPTREELDVDAFAQELAERAGRGDVRAAQMLRELAERVRQMAERATNGEATNGPESNN